MSSSTFTALPEPLSNGVRGWLTKREAAALKFLATDKIVLELGSYEGLSTVCLAETAKMVHAVDWHRCDADTRRLVPGTTSTLETFVNNLRAKGLDSKVTVHVGAFEDVLPRFADAQFDLVFVDGNHSRATVVNDAKQACRLVKPGGVIAFHDWDEPQVVHAVTEVMGREPDRQDDALAMYAIPGMKPEEPAPSVPIPWASVFLACPNYGPIEPQAVESWIQAVPAVSNVIARWHRRPERGSLLCCVFNKCLTACLNSQHAWGWTHFAMHHADVAGEVDWLEKLILEKRRCGADVLSVVIPFKDGRGLTSTAIRNKRTSQVRRLTMHEVHELPPTFGIEDIPNRDPDDELVVNTGLWVCDVKPWLRDFAVKGPEDGRGHGAGGFHIIDDIVDIEGKLQVAILSEDWNFSRWCNAHGLKVMATRAIKAAHYGVAEFSNERPWGDWTTDKGDYWKEEKPNT